MRKAINNIIDEIEKIASTKSPTPYVFSSWHEARIKTTLEKYTKHIRKQFFKYYLKNVLDMPNVTIEEILFIARLCYQKELRIEITKRNGT